MNHVFSDVVFCSFFEASFGKIFAQFFGSQGSYGDKFKACNSKFLKLQELAAACLKFVAIAALTAEGCRLYVEWVNPSINRQQICAVFRCRHPQLHIRWYQWNVQVLTNVTVQVLFLYGVWFLSYSCFSCFYADLLHGDMVLPHSKIY